MEKEDQGKNGRKQEKYSIMGGMKHQSDFENFSQHIIYPTSTIIFWQIDLAWKTLDFALKVNDDSVNSALPSLYSNIAKCYEELGNIGKAKDNYDLSASQNNPSDKDLLSRNKSNLKTGDF